MKKLPDPKALYPLTLPDGSVFKAIVQLANAISHPNIEIGSFTYYHDERGLTDFASALAPYLAPGRPEKLIIGKFCQIAQGVQFVTSSVKHPMERISTFPFSIFDPEYFNGFLEETGPHVDNVVGNDCWIGREAILLPGAKLGNGVIVGARAVVSECISDYAVVVGNPAKVIRYRYSDEEIECLLSLRWWDWSPGQIEAALPLIESEDVYALADFLNQRSEK